MNVVAASINLSYVPVEMPIFMTSPSCHLIGRHKDVEVSLLFLTLIILILFWKGESVKHNIGMALLYYTTSHQLYIYCS